MPQAITQCKNPNSTGRLLPTTLNGAVALTDGAVIREAPTKKRQAAPESDSFDQSVDEDQPALT